MTSTGAAVRWGIVLGIAVCAWTLVLHLSGLYTKHIGWGQVADGLAIALPVGVIALALRDHRRRKARGLRVAESLRTGLVVGLVSAPISAAFLWWYHHYLNPHWLDFVVAWKTETMTAAGASAAEITRAAGSLRAGGTDRAQVIGAFVGSVVFSLVIAALAHLYFRRPSDVRDE